MWLWVVGVVHMVVVMVTVTYMLGARRGGFLWFGFGLDWSTLVWSGVWGGRGFGADVPTDETR